MSSARAKKPLQTCCIACVTDPPRARNAFIQKKAGYSPSQKKALGLRAVCSCFVRLTPFSCPSLHHQRNERQRRIRMARLPPVVIAPPDDQEPEPPLDMSGPISGNFEHYAWLIKKFSTPNYDKNTSSIYSHLRNRKRLERPASSSSSSSGARGGGGKILDQTWWSGILPRRLTNEEKKDAHSSRKRIGISSSSSSLSQQQATMPVLLCLKCRRPFCGVIVGG